MTRGGIYIDVGLIRRYSLTKGNKMSTFKVEVIRIGAITKHPNADKLSLTKAFEYPVVIKTGDFNESDLAVYVPEDAIVPTDRPEFSYMKGKDGKARIKAIRLRGIYSEGLLVRAPIGAEVGQDVAALLGITKYEEPVPETPVLMRSQQESPPKEAAAAPKYEVEALFRNATAIPEGSLVVFNEKVHGCSSRYVFTNALHVGSHNVWRRGPQAPDKKAAIWAGIKEGVKSALSFKFRNLVATAKKAYGVRMGVVSEDVWWGVARKYDLASKLKKIKSVVLYGEVYGHVQDLTYGVSSSDVVDFVLFDAFVVKENRFLNYEELRRLARQLGLPMVPELYTGQMPSIEKAKEIAAGDGKSMICPSQIREGAVVRLLSDSRVRDRALYKIVTEAYKLRNNGTECK